MLEAYVELDRSREELLEEFDADVVERALRLVDRAEYKRQQAPPVEAAEGVRQGPADADHEPLGWLTSQIVSTNLR